MNRFIENYISNLGDNILISDVYIGIVVTILNKYNELYVIIHRDTNMIKVSLFTYGDGFKRNDIYEYINDRLNLLDIVNRELYNKLNVEHNIESKIKEYLKNNKDFINMIIMFKDDVIEYAVNNNII